MVVVAADVTDAAAEEMVADAADRALAAVGGVEVVVKGPSRGAVLVGKSSIASDSGARVARAGSDMSLVDN